MAEIHDHTDSKAYNSCPIELMHGTYYPTGSCYKRNIAVFQSARGFGYGLDIPCPLSALGRNSLSLANIG